MGKRHRRQFTDGFKAETVKLIRESGRTVASVARDLDLTETAPRYLLRDRDRIYGSCFALYHDSRYAATVRVVQMEFLRTAGCPQAPVGVQA